MQTSIEPRIEQVQCRAWLCYSATQIANMLQATSLVRRFARQRRDTGDQGVLTSGLAPC